MVLQVLQVPTLGLLPELLLVVNHQELKVDQAVILLVLQELRVLVHRPKKGIIYYRGHETRSNDKYKKK